MTLNPIEMALVAELDLEMARANETVAEDGSQSAETRHSAREAASRWRERARAWRMEARRLGTESIVPDHPYTGPERRMHERRQRERREDGNPPVAGPGRDRRVGPDRRRDDRRRR